jgi:hypothetical protein
MCHPTLTKLVTVVSRSFGRHPADDLDIGSRPEIVHDLWIRERVVVLSAVANIRVDEYRAALVLRGPPQGFDNGVARGHDPHHRVLSWFLGDDRRELGKPSDRLMNRLDKCGGQLYGHDGRIEQRKKPGHQRAEVDPVVEHRQDTDARDGFGSDAV